MEKSELRRVFLARQMALGAAERLERSRAVSDRFFREFPLEGVRRLHLFLSMPGKGEIDTRPLIERLWRGFPGIALVVPRVDPAADRLEHLEYGSETELRTSDWGIDEPVGGETVGEDEIDMVLVPLLAFDRRGYRVGHGKGYYDRFLARCRADAPKIGLSLFGPVGTIADTHAGDVSLDYCVTPEKMWNFDGES